MKKKLIALPYIYPVCPLNFNHTKMFVVGDVLNRYYLANGFSVTFPVASHFTGNTSQSSIDALTRVFNKEGTEGDLKVYNLYKNGYKTPEKILQNFGDANGLLDYYTSEILWELRSLQVSCDYKHTYSTSHKDFSVFVKTIVDQYDKHHLLIKNKNDELALNYDDQNWKAMATDLIEKTEFQQSFHKQNILSARANIRSDWEILRNSGFGVKYKNGLIIDPMFDSELFTIFDLYMIFKDQVDSEKMTVSAFFKYLFKILKSGEKPENKLAKIIIKHLPCSIFVCEEHLKNWVVKKFYAESLLLHPKYQTKKYHVLGMGALDGKRMSASRGHAILSKDLINQYGGLTTRLIILLSGGNLSKAYNYDRNLPQVSQKMIDQFTSYLLMLVAKHGYEVGDFSEKKRFLLQDSVEKIEQAILSGYFRQAVIELLTLIPKKYPTPKSNEASALLSLYKKYLQILLPGLFETVIV